VGFPLLKLVLLVIAVFVLILPLRIFRRPGKK
jgi:hypothetical protein